MRRQVRPNLAPSTTRSLAYHAATWALVVGVVVSLPIAATALLLAIFGPTIVSVFTTSCVSGIDSTATTICTLALTFTALYGYALASILLVCSSRHLEFFQFHHLIPLDGRWIRHRTHISHLQPTKFTRLLNDQPFTIFVMGTSSLTWSPFEGVAPYSSNTAAILVSKDTTILEILATLQHRKHLPPFSWHSHILTLSNRNLELHEAVGDLGLGPMSHLFICFLVRGGAATSASASNSQPQPRQTARVSEPSRRLNSKENTERGTIVGVVRAVVDDSEDANHNATGVAEGSKSPSLPISVSSDEEQEPSKRQKAHSGKASKRRRVLTSESDNEGGDECQAPQCPHPKKKKASK
ncbi:hypothetical protein JAAARDRAFT_697366, partial [Jaapia argillacea MUCL 33604]